ncbi:MAG TPA: hemolysin family protein [Kineosporiaceae bacterium]|nr:hemolysin family protein [Kineosporiaceae bacterium]
MNAGALSLALGLLLLNAFFVGAEFAVVSARRSQIEPLAAEGRRGARTTLWALEHLSLMLACAQLGITVASLGLGAVAEPAVAQLLEVPFAAAGLPHELLHPVAFVLGLAIVVYLHVVVGELVPKNLAIAGPERAALVLAPALVAVARVVKPLLTALSAATRLLLRLLRVEPKEELASAFTAEEVHSIVTESRREGLLDEEEHDLLTGALELSSRPASEVMVPLRRLVTVPVGATPEEVERVVARTGFSRLPVVAARRSAGAGNGATGGAGAPDADELVGYLHVKDLLFADDVAYTAPVPDGRVRTLVTLPSDEDVEDALVAMQRAGTHLARIDDEAGSAVGVVFLEDVLEELVGEVSDATQRPQGRAGARP